jgi:hypothetical protein
LYGGFVPAARSGLTGKTGMPGDMANLVGDAGSIGTGLSFSRARLTVLTVLLRVYIGAVVYDFGVRVLVGKR